MPQVFILTVPEIPAKFKAFHCVKKFVASAIDCGSDGGEVQALQAAIPTPATASKTNEVSGFGVLLLKKLDPSWPHESEGILLLYEAGLYEAHLVFHDSQGAYPATAPVVMIVVVPFNAFIVALSETVVSAMSILSKIQWYFSPINPSDIAPLTMALKSLSKVRQTIIRTLAVLSEARAAAIEAELPDSKL